VDKVMREKTKTEGAPEWFDQNVIVLMNPSKRRMRPADAPEERAALDAKTFKLQDWEKYLPGTSNVATLQDP